MVNQDGNLTGIIDGDLRRALHKVGDDLLRRRASEFMTRNPKVIEKGELAAKAVEVMERYAITSLIIVDTEGRPEGVIHLHDLLKAGIM